MSFIPHQSRLWLVMQIMLLLLSFWSTVAAWQLPMPGGSSVSFDDGVLRIGKPSAGTNSECTIPSVGTAMNPSILGRIQVKDTGNTMKGFGAFCETESIPKNTFLGFYPTESCIVRDLNENLDEPIKTENISNKGDYLLSIDGGVTFLDGYERAQDRSIFSPVHLNHNDKGNQGCNCFRLAKKESVAFFTKRDIQVGEELCFDYGSNYWRGRESAKI